MATKERSRRQNAVLTFGLILWFSAVSGLLGGCGVLPPHGGPVVNPPGQTHGSFVNHFSISLPDGLVQSINDSICHALEQKGFDLGTGVVLAATDVEPQGDTGLYHVKCTARLLSPTIQQVRWVVVEGAVSLRERGGATQTGFSVRDYRPAFPDSSPSSPVMSEEELSEILIQKELRAASPDTRELYPHALGPTNVQALVCNTFDCSLPTIDKIGGTQEIASRFTADGLTTVQMSPYVDEAAVWDYLRNGQALLAWYIDCHGRVTGTSTADGLVLTTCRCHLGGWTCTDNESYMWDFEFKQLSPYLGLVGCVIFVNACNSFTDPLRSSICTNHAVRTYIGTTTGVQIGTAVNFARAFWRKVLAENKTINVAIDEASRETGAVGTYAVQGYVGTFPPSLGCLSDKWDPLDDTRSNATELPVPTTEQQTHGPHKLVASCDTADWFKVYLMGGRTYNFNTTGGTGDNYAELYNLAGIMVASDNDSGGNYQFSLTYTPTQSGTFYLRVRPYSAGTSCSYTLRYRWTSSTGCPTVTLTSPASGAQNIASPVTYRFAVKSPAGRPMTVTLYHGKTRDELRLIQIWTGTSSGEKTSLPFVVDARSTYYWKVTVDDGVCPIIESPVSTYTTASNPTSCDAWDPGDNTWNGAVQLATPTTTEQTHGPHRLCTSPSDPGDWFKVYLTAGYTYNFNTIGGSGDNYGELYNQLGVMVASDNDSGGNYQFSLTYTPTQSGTFYLRVRPYSAGTSCSYILRYRRTK